MGPEMGAGGKVRQGVPETADHRIDDGGQRERIAGHRRAEPGAQDLALREDQFERAVNAFVGGLPRRDQILEGDPRRGDAAAEIA